MKISSEILTRDEIQHRVVAELFSHSLHEHLVFHGGTMLRVCALPSYRFSEDIDILLYGTEEEAFFPVFELCAKEAGAKMGTKITVGSDETSYVKYLVWERDGDMGIVNIDVKVADALESSVETEIFGLQNNYPDLPSNLKITCFSIPQLLSTKFDCISDRIAGRDIYDFWKLSDSNATLSKAWRMHCASYRSDPCDVPPEKMLVHLLANENAFCSSLAFSMSSGLISAKITPQKIVEEVAAKFATLPSVEQPSRPKGK